MKCLTKVEPFFNLSWFLMPRFLLIEGFFSLFFTDKARPRVEADQDGQLKKMYNNLVCPEIEWQLIWLTSLFLGNFPVTEVNKWVYGW